jgi:two-component system response regulator YesN
MYNTLIVDDEFYAVEAIVRGVNWSELNISEVFKANSVSSAKKIFLSKNIHILLADIEMPEEDGLDLLEWVNCQYPSVKTIFLTAHSNFDYARKALQLGSFDYIVKPVDKKRLSTIITQAVEVLTKEQTLRSKIEHQEEYLSLWNANRLFLTECFWQQLVDQQINIKESDLFEYFKIYNIPFLPGQPICIILFHIDHWEKDFSLRDMKMLQYAIKKAATEIMDNKEGVEAFYDRYDHLVLIQSINNEGLNYEEMTYRCGEFIQACQTFFYSQLSCYVSEPSHYMQISSTCEKLRVMERSNVTRQYPIRFEKNFIPATGDFIELKWLPIIQAYLEVGNTEEANACVEDMFTHLLYLENMTQDLLHTIYFGILFILFECTRKLGIKVESIYGMTPMNQSQATRNLRECKEWVHKIIDLVNGMPIQTKETNILIKKIHQYIDLHICEDFTREDIANHVHLNPVYLSRMYKKETGDTLTDYILEKRMELAKKYLLETPYKVTTIMEMVGYQSFSHFNQMFKKIYKMTPLEFRKSYRQF